ncbi:MAG: hypothetical protein IKA31_05745 [Clostridia bacterium]|nr:hypothetical protein [Clostridia bacterium]
MNEFVLSTEILTEFEFESPKDYKVNAIVLLVENSRLNEGYSLDMLGKQMKEWVRDCVSHFDCKFVSLQEKDNPLEIVKPFIGEEDYTIVLFSDTPVLKASTVLDVLDYATTKQLDFCKLPRGFIVNSQNFKANKIETSAEPNFVEKEDFFAVFDCKTLATAKTILKNRILEKHLKNKVIINDLNSVVIDCQVEIAPFVEINSNNVIKGNTKIEKLVKLKENNVIENCLINEGCEIFCSVLKNTTIESKNKIGPFKVIEGEE